MTQYDILNTKWSNSQLSKIKPGMENGNEVNLNFSSSAVGNSNDATNFLHKLLLANRKVSIILKMVHQII